MGNNYTAFGLGLSSSFPLPGLACVGEGELPALRLELASEEELERHWSGARSPSSWKGRLGDGAELKIAQGRAGDQLFSYGTAASFLLDPSAGTMLCSAVEPDSLPWRRTLISRILPLVAIVHGCEALHAAAVEMGAGVVAVVGASGAGKSTLAAELVRRGNRLVADDVLVLGRIAGRVTALPGSPHLSIDAGRKAIPGAKVLGEHGGKLWTVVDDAVEEPAPVVAIALLQRDDGSVQVEELPRSPLSLAPFMLGLPDDDGRDGARFSLYADLVETARLLQLRGDGSAAALAGVLERAVQAPLPTAVGALR
jgi:HPr Serine kinase C-terminal domain